MDPSTDSPDCRLRKSWRQSGAMMTAERGHADGSCVNMHRYVFVRINISVKTYIKMHS